jgi:RNA polymerase sigma-70 factor (ECF subfamily)
VTAAWPKIEGNETFSQTRWTWVLRATHGSAEESVEAWESLVRQYWKPLYVFCRKKGDSPETAEDHVQGFFHELLSHRRLTGVDPASGKLRNWLMAVMVQHRSRVWRAAQAQKRRPFGGFDPRELSEIDQTLQIKGTDSAEDAFQRQWAHDLLEQAYQEMRGRYEARGQEAKFLRFWPRLAPGARPEEHHTLAKSLRMTSGALATALWQFRQEYQRILRKTVRATLEEGDDVDAELRELIRALSEP